MKVRFLQAYNDIKNNFSKICTVKPLVQSPLNDNNFVKFMRGLDKGYKF